MMSQTSSRVRRVFKNIKEKTPNAIMIKNSTEPHIDQSFFYFSGLDSGLFEGCALLLQPGGEITLYTSKLEQETAQRGSTELNVKVFEKKDELDLFIKDFGKDVDSLGVNSREVTYGEVENLKKSRIVMLEGVPIKSGRPKHLREGWGNYTFPALRFFVPINRDSRMTRLLFGIHKAS